MNVQTKTVPARRYFCVAEDVTQPEIGFFAQRAVGPLYETAKQLSLEIAGDLELICPQWNVEGKSRVMFAIPVAGAGSDRGTAAAPAPHFFWDSPPFQCAWTDYKGSMPNIKAAWAAFGDAVKMQGLQGTPNMAWREIYKYWEDFNSDNNVTELQLETARDSKK
jgi:hypothetical protein